MNRTLPVSIFAAASLLAACDGTQNHKPIAAKSAESSASAPPAHKAEASGAFQILGDNHLVLERYRKQKDAAALALQDIQAAVAKAPSVLAHFRRNASSAEIAEHSKLLQTLSSQTSQQFGIGIMSPPLGECGALAEAATEYWQALLNAKTEGRQPDASYREVYQESIKACRAAIAQPPQASVTIKLRPGSAAPAGHCRKVLEFTANGVAIDRGKMVCPAAEMAALK